MRNESNSQLIKALLLFLGIVIMSGGPKEGKLYYAAPSLFPETEHTNEDSWIRARRGMIIIALIASTFAFLAFMIYSCKSSTRALVIILVMRLLSVGFEGVFRGMLKKSVTHDST